MDALQRVALAHPSIAFESSVDGRVGSSMPAGDWRERALAGLGDDYRNAHRLLEREAGGLRLQGVLGAPTVNRSRADRQFLYVNGRFVRDRMLGYAVRQAYSDQIGYQRPLSKPCEKSTTISGPTMKVTSVPGDSSSSCWRYSSSAVAMSFER